MIVLVVVIVGGLAGIVGGEVTRSCSDKAVDVLVGRKTDVTRVRRKAVDVFVVVSRGS